MQHRTTTADSQEEIPSVMRDSSIKKLEDDIGKHSGSTNTNEQVLVHQEGFDST
jgi:hypothetical protein